MAPEDLERLRAGFLDAVERYISELRRTCELLRACRREAITPERQTEIQRQRAREGGAYTRYASLRARLLEELGIVDDI